MAGRALSARPAFLCGVFMELENLKNAKPWVKVGLAVLATLFCCCCLIVVLAVLGPLIGDISGTGG
jgi:hypothetical protein